MNAAQAGEEYGSHSAMAPETGSMAVRLKLTLSRSGLSGFCFGFTTDFSRNFTELKEHSVDFSVSFFRAPFRVLFP